MLRPSLFFLTLVIAVFHLGVSSCSSGNTPQESPSAPTPSSATSILNAPIEDKRALLVMMQAAANSTGSVSQAPRQGGLPFVSTAHAAPLTCTGGSGTMDITISEGNTLVPHVEGNDLRLLFTDFTAQMRFDQCKVAPITGCSFPYILNGSYQGIINGEIVKANFSTGPSRNEYNNIRSNSRTSETCSGLTIDTSNDLGRARSMGLDISATINGIQNSGENIMNLVQYSGTVCIDNVHYLVPSKEEWFSLQRELCGG